MGKKLLPALVLPAVVLAAGLLGGQVVYDPAPAAGNRAPNPEPPARRPRSPLVSPTVIEELERLRSEGSPHAAAEFEAGDIHPRAVFGVEFLPGAPPATGAAEATSGSPLTDVQAERIARRFLASFPGIFGIAPEELSLAAVLREGDGQDGVIAVRFGQLFRGTPVRSGGLVVQLDASGAVTAALSGLYRGIRRVPPPRVDEAAALEAARRKLGEPASAPVPPLLRVAGRLGADRLVWDVRLRSRGRPWRVLVDAQTASVLGAGSLLRSACAVPPKGLAYSTNAVEGPATLRELPDLDCQSITLSGHFVRSHDWGGEDQVTLDPLLKLRELGRMPNGRDGGVLFDSASPPSVSQVNVYLHATLIHDRVSRLGFTGLDRPFPTVTNVRTCYGWDPCENAFYDPLYIYANGPGLLLFGLSDAVNFGLDGDVVYHEYFHGVVEGTAKLGDDVTDPDFFLSMALNEAYSDYFSSTVGGDALLGEGVGTALGDVAIRNLQNNKRWPDDVDAFDSHQTGLIWGGALWDIRQAFSAGGANAEGIDRADGLAYGCLISLPSNANLVRAASALVSTATAKKLSTAEVSTVREILGRRGLIAAGGVPPTVFEELQPGGEASGDISAVLAGGVRLAPVQYRLTVPEDGARLVLNLASTAGDVNIDLYVRFNTPVVASATSVTATYRSEAKGGEESLIINHASTPPLGPGTHFIAVANRSPVIAAYRLTTQLTTGQVVRLEPIPFGGSVSSTLPGNALGTIQYTVEVADAFRSRLEVAAAAAVDLELYLRHGEPVVTAGEGNIVADVSAGHPPRAPAVSLGALTVPPLRAGYYFLALKNLSPDPAGFTIRADLVDEAPPDLQQFDLQPGEVWAGSAEASLPGTGLLLTRQARLLVPDEGASLRLQLRTAGELGIYLRRDARVDLAGGRLRFDHASDSRGPGDEELTVDLFGTPQLQPGLYHVALVNRGGQANFSVRAEVSTATSGASIRAIQSGVWVTGTAEAGDGAGGRLATEQYRLVVDAGTAGLDVLLDPKAAGDLDLFIRKDRPVQVIESNVVADRRGATERGAEAITILSRDLEPGNYFLAVLNHSLDPVAFQLLAVAGAQPLSVSAKDGDRLEGRLSLAPAPPNRCTLGTTQLVVDVPPEATRLSLSVETPDGGPLDVLLRVGSRVLLDRGELVFDRRASSATGPLVVPGADLQAGLYFFALVNCQSTEQAFRATVKIEIPVASESALEDGLFARGTAIEPLPGRSPLHPAQYAIEVGPRVKELAVGVFGEGCQGADLDLYLRAGERVGLDPASGEVQATWRSESVGDRGEWLSLNERSNPPLAPGRYFIAVRNRESSPTPFRVGARTLPAPSETSERNATLVGLAIASPQQGSGILHPVEYRLETFTGADRLVLDLSGDGDVDLFLRHGLPVILEPSGLLVADHQSSTSRRQESITVTFDGAPCLRPGVYFIAIANYEARKNQFSLSNQVQGFPSVLARIGDVVAGSVPAAEPGEERPADVQVRIEVPAGSQGFQVDMVSESRDVAGNLDLFVRRDAPVEFKPSLVTTYSSREGGIAEAIVVPTSKLAPGRYYVAVSSHSSEEIRHLLRIRPLLESEREMGLGVAEGGVADPSSAHGLPWLLGEQFRLRLPPGLPEVRVRLGMDDPGSPLELYMRRGARVEAEGTGITADLSAGGTGGEKVLRLASPAAGDYYLAVRNLRTRGETFQIEALAGAEHSAIRGDADETGQIDLTDVIAILQRLFLSGPSICSFASDADDTGVLDLTDPIYLLNHLFLGGPAPPAPFPGCGPLPPNLPEKDCSGAACR